MTHAALVHTLCASLCPQVAAEFAAQGFHQWHTQTGRVSKNQDGVMRVNCIDCLDRTNVVQGVFARKVRVSCVDCLDRTNVVQGVFARKERAANVVQGVFARKERAAEREARRVRAYFGLLLWRVWMCCAWRVCKAWRMSG